MRRVLHIINEDKDIIIVLCIMVHPKGCFQGQFFFRLSVPLLSLFQCINTLLTRYGFPPRELHPPDEGHDEDPVPLQHGDRVMVEHLKPVVPEQIPPDVVMSEVNVQGGESSASSEAEAKSDQQRQGYNLINIVVEIFIIKYCSFIIPVW